MITHIKHIKHIVPYIGSSLYVFWLYKKGFKKNGERRKFTKRPLDH